MMRKPLLTALLAVLPVVLLLCGFVRAQGPESVTHPELTLIKKEILPAAYGVKSVVMDADSSNVYSMNLEGMSVFDFDRKTRELKRKLVFVPHKGRGYDYARHKWIEDSYQEKPVEARLTKGGRYLWISLHNAGGVVAWDLRGGDTYVKGRPYKEAWVYQRLPARTGASKDVANMPDAGMAGIPSDGAANAATAKFEKRKVRLLFIKTGSIPKVITSTPDGKYLFVANWHSGTVSEISIASPRPVNWVKVKDLKGLVIPRGLAASPDSRYLYVAQMGGSAVQVVKIPQMKKVRAIGVGVNPRHIVMDGRYMYVSLNKASELVKVDLRKGRVVKKVRTGDYPRTIAMSGDGRIVFVTCYRGDRVQAFSADNLSLLGSWVSMAHPVGVSVYQRSNRLEAWVADYTSGKLDVFTLRERNYSGLMAGN